MEKEKLRTRLLGVTALAAKYCAAVETAAESEQNEFVGEMLQLLPRLYLEFNDIVPGSNSSSGCCHDDCNCDHDDCDCGHDHDHDSVADPEDEFSPIALSEEEHPYYGSYVDEDYYESVRRHIEMLLGPDDIFLETFEEDMKYSDTPIASSISECLADIFQPLYNFISIVKESEGEELTGAYRECHENFVSYWAQTLCNVLRALNNLFYRH